MEEAGYRKETKEVRKRGGRRGVGNGLPVSLLL